MAKGKDNNDPMTKLNNDQSSTTKNYDFQDFVFVEDYVSDDDEVSSENQFHMLWKIKFLKT